MRGSSVAPVFLRQGHDSSRLASPDGAAPWHPCWPHCSPSLRSPCPPRPGRRSDREPGKRVGAPHLARRHRPLPAGRVHHPEDVALVHGRRRPDHAQHRPPPDGPRGCPAAPLLPLHARPRPLRHPAARRRGPGGLGGRAPPLRRPGLPAGLQPGLQGRAALGGPQPAAHGPPGGHRRRARQPRLGADRLPRHRGPGRDRSLPGHERARDRPPVGTPEPLVRLRHASRHRAVATSAQGLPHPLALPRASG